MQKRVILFAGTSGAIAVALGAMAAHFLKSKAEAGLLSENNLHAFKTASEYQMYHSIILLLIGFIASDSYTKLVKKSTYCFMAGIVLFSGSLYILSTAALMGITNLKWLGPVTPIGGMFFIAGWVLLGLSAFRRKNS
jgi:uncharacterized membrane protein YgdD (TMEM256/DUF423 family)